MLCAFVVVGLASYIRSWLSDNSWGLVSSTAANFLIFVGGISVLVLIYLLVAPHYFTGPRHRFVFIGIESAMALLWFSAFVAWVAYLNKNSGFKCSYYEICNNSRAAVSFAGFEWALFLVTSILSCFAARKP
ncbi:MAG: hypothetical protein M1814_003948 [Vezdaea aestivalis]|nr:MAG: hypothetical protein M1814_003948 [Vezdaea aestivalis]